MDNQTKQLNSTSRTSSPDEIGYFATAKKAEIDAFNHAKVYLSTYSQVFDELKNRGIANYWNDTLNTSKDVDVSDYIPDSSDTLERLETLQKQIAPYTAQHLLPGDF